MFNANGENIKGIYDKLNFLKDCKAPVKNCVIVLDSSILSGTENVYNRLYIEHPVISDESKLYFHFTFLSSFLSTDFFMPYIFYKFKFFSLNFFQYCY